MISIKKYEYMVVYNFPKGMGRMQITTKKKIEKYENLVEIDEEIKKESGERDSFITNFKLLREYIE